MSCDHYHSREPGLLANNNGQILMKKHARCGTVMVDHTSDYVFHFIQTSIEGSQTLDDGHAFETFSESCGVKTKHCHADNHVLNHALFKESSISVRQTQSFCGVNAHHQNGVTERKIRTIVSLACAMMFNAMIKWPSPVHLELWPRAINCAIEILNSTPRSSGFTPKEIFGGTKGDRFFRNFHTFGSPDFVLDPSLQAGQKTPAWKPRSSPCVLIRKSKNLASNISLILDPHANCIKQQFHLVHDDEFQTVATTTNDSLPTNWRDTFEKQHHADDPSFTSPIEASDNGRSFKVKVRTNDEENQVAPNTPAPEEFLTVPRVMNASTSVHDNATETNAPASQEDAIEPPSNEIPSDSDKTSDSSFAQCARSEKRVLKQNKLLNSVVLGFLSIQTGTRLNDKCVPAIPSMLKSQASCHESIKILEDKTRNQLHPLTYLESTANEDVMCFHEAMKADDSIVFKEGMASQTNNFKEESVSS